MALQKSLKKNILGNRTIVLLEQNVLDNATLSFDDNKILKMPIGYSNICSSVQDNRQKFNCL